MKFNFATTLVLVNLLLVLKMCHSGKNAILLRKKRYLTFPEGASVSVAFCLTAQLWIYPPGIFTESIAWGLGYDLPNDTSSVKGFFPKLLTKRRNRRDLYGKIERIMDSMGYNGRSCVLRSLCEASYRFLPRENNLTDLILKIVFGYPEKEVLLSEPEEHRVYHWAAQMGKESTTCSKVFNQCPFSLIDMALGYYSMT